MRQYGEILSVGKEGNLARVLIRKHSACGKCGKCSERNNLQIKVDNHIGAEVGDIVILEMKSRSLLNAALLVYLAPIVSLIVGYLFGVALGVEGELGRIFLGGSFFMISFLGARYFGKIKASDYNLEIITIIRS